MRPVPSAAAELANLRTWRARRPYDNSVGRTITQARQSLRRRGGKLAAAIEAWDTVVPDEVARASVVTAMRGGVLDVTVDGSPIAWRLRRMLRGGLLDQLQACCSASLRDVRVRVA